MTQAASPGGAGMVTAGTVTTGWLSDLVKRWVPGVPPRALVRRQPVNLLSTSSVLYRLTPVSPGGGQAGPSAVIKLPREADQRHRREVMFYREAAPRLRGSVPACYAADDGSSGPGYLLLEDCGLDRAVPSMDAAPFPVLAEIVRFLARLHAGLWRSLWAGVGAVPFSSGPAVNAVAEVSAQQLLNRWENFFSAADVRRIREVFDQREQLAAGLSGASVLCHGDFHQLNILRGPAGCVAVDWQDAHFGNPAVELAKFTAAYVHPLDRRRAEQRWIEMYHRALREHGIKDYEFSDFVADYRVGLALAVLSPLIWSQISGLREEGILLRAKNVLMAAEEASRDCQ